LIGSVGLLGLCGALLYGSASPQHAAAEKCLTCEEEPPVEAEHQTLTIHVSGLGTVKKGTTVYCENTSGGTKTCEKQLIEGQTVTLTATPGAGLSFIGWSGDCSGAGSCEVTMNEAKDVTATFADVTPPSPPTITSPTSGQVFEWTAEESISVSFNNSGDASTAAFLCRVDVNDSSGAAICSSPWGTGKLAAGKHTVYVWAKDSVGNVSSPASSGFEVKITPPKGEEGGSEEGKEPPKEEGGSGSGGGTQGGGAPGTGASTPPPPSIAPAIAARAVVKWHLLGRSTVLRKLVLKGLPAGASVAASCKGKGCPFKRRQVRVAGGVADLSALFAKRQLAAGALIEIKATAPGMTGETIDIKIRAGKAPKVITS
jgi:hypothetical protein